MILIATALSLIAIVFGMFLLAKAKSETLGKFFKLVSWFVIVMGFLCLLCLGIRCVKRCCSRGDGQCRKEMGVGEGRHCRGGKENAEEMDETHCNQGRQGKHCSMMDKENSKHCCVDSSLKK